MALALTPREILEKGEYCLLAAGPHWERVPLGRIADVQNGAAFKSKYFTHGEGLPLIRIRDVGKTETDNHYDGPYEDEHLVYPEDIIIGMDGEFKAAKWTGEIGLLNQRVCRLKIKSSHIDHDFLFYCLQPFLDAINAETSSVTVKHLSSRTVAEIPLPLPPLNEQRRIVAKIEELFSELDKGVESLKAARAQLKTYRQSLLKAAFEGRLTEQWRRDNADKLETADQLLQRIREEREARYQQQLEEWKAAVAEWETGGKLGKKPRRPSQSKRLPPVESTDTRGFSSLPEKWAWVRLGDLCPLKNGYAFKSKEYKSGGVPLIRISNIDSDGNVRPKGVFVERREGLDDFLVVQGDILIALSGATTGKYGVYKGLQAGYLNQRVGAWTAKESISGVLRFIFYILGLKKNFILDEAYGGAQPNISSGTIDNMVIPLCPHVELEYLCDVLESNLSQVNNLNKTIDSALHYSETLRQSILKRAFEGKLVPQDPEDEPASVLLERIRQEQADAPNPNPRNRKTRATA